MNGRNGLALSRLFLLLGVIGIGFSAIFVRLAGIPGVVSAFWRVAISLSLLLPLWLARGRRLPGRRAVAFAALSGAFFGIDLALWNTSLFYTNATNATLIAYLAPVWVGLAAMALFRERLPALYWIGAAVAFGGMVVVLGVRNVASIGPGTGETLAFIASFFWAGYLVSTQAGRAGADTLSFTTISVTASAVVLAVLCAVRGETLGGFSGETWLWLLLLGLGSHALSYLAINRALGHLPASTVSVTLLGQPVVTAIAAIWTLGEPLGLHQAAGGLLVMAGIYLVNKRRARA